ncbi:MAG: DUF2283 domain-containing protein [Anaerolineales bacterium]|nr:DUF2283 domain-containing protein [Anaerolineales bacterium]
MKFHYYPETDSLYIELSEHASVDSREVAPGLVLDFDAEGRLISLDIDHASQVVNLQRLEVDSLPLTAFSLVGLKSEPAR